MPRNRACYDYGYAAAVAPVARGESVPCDRDHTAITFSVGELDTVVDGHLVSVDSDRVQAQVAEACPRAFEQFVGGTVEARRLTMLRPVWFTPSLRQSDAGANWYRCDAVAIAADESLAPLVGRLQGVLGPAAGRRALRHVRHGRARHRRLQAGDLLVRPRLARAEHRRHRRAAPTPASRRSAAAGQQVCQDAASAQADDPLNYRWGYEWPTEQQWQAGQHYGICWAPA